MRYNKNKKVLILSIMFLLLVAPVMAFVSQPPSFMSVMKQKGCMFSSLLFPSIEDYDSYLAMLERSDCEYLPRAVETWNNPPDFDMIEDNMARITKTNLMYGMFIAESIKTDAVYYYPDEQRNFNFNSMCKKGTLGQWGANTCVPSFAYEEYRKYLRYITRKAIDIGIKDFLFGQVFLQDEEWTSPVTGVTTGPFAGEVVAEMKDYASSKGKQIAVGAQTNDLTGDYLKNFDYILGGTYLDPDGNIEDGPCLSTVTDYCQALLWDEQYASSASNVIIELDWHSSDDDIHRFAKLTQEKRKQFLKEKYSFFKSNGVGFTLPFRIILNGGSPEGNCYGFNQWVYSADNKYSCKDEDGINKILLGILCSDENEFCGGIAGIECCEGLKCQLEGTYPDASGICVKETAKLNITTIGNLPFGVVDKEYSATVSALGGSDSYVWTVTSGELPPGLELKNPTCIQSPCQAPATISGTPTSTGLSYLTLTVKSGKESASQNYKMIIVDEPYIQILSPLTKTKVTQSPVEVSGVVYTFCEGVCPSEITVNGVEPYETWQIKYLQPPGPRDPQVGFAARVPVQPGPNTIIAVVKDAYGQEANSSSVVVNLLTANCTDSDNGKYYYGKGSCIDLSESVSWDSCVGNTLREFYCSESSECTYVERQCLYGCEDGACKVNETGCASEADGCCFGEDDGYCDPDCDEDEDSDCVDCTPEPGDCCDPSDDGFCDPDCSRRKDPDCEKPVCNENNLCELSKEESSVNCPSDCWCDDGICDAKENNKNCPKDCWQCVSEWECRLEPAICSAEGIQNKVCVDVKCGKGKERKEAVKCITGTCEGCLEENECYTIETRITKDKTPKYCDVSKRFVKQKYLGAPCQNNYECKSNACVESKCRSIELLSLWQRLLLWIKGVIG